MLNARQMLAVLMDHNGTVEVVFVECVECGERDSERADGMIDKEAERMFRRRGWSVKPTLCPKHNRARKRVQKEQQNAPTE